MTITLRTRSLLWLEIRIVEHYTTLSNRGYQFTIDELPYRVALLNYRYLMFALRQSSTQRRGDDNNIL